MNEIFNDDCVHGLQMIPDGSVDLTVTSPPYDALRTYGLGNNLFDFEGLARELYRVTKTGGVVVWIVGDMVIKGSESGTSFRQALFFMDCGFRLHDTMIYQKQGVVYPDINRYYQTFEYMFVLSKGKPKTVHLIADKPNKNAGALKGGTERAPNEKLRKPSALRNKTGRRVKSFGVRYNIWEVKNGMGLTTKDKRAFKHPAMFPEELARDHIISWSDEGDLVLDPFMGAGTTAKMAVLTGRKYIGFELNAEYCELARRRVKEAFS